MGSSKKILKEIQDYVHPLAVNREVNGTIPPWHEAHQDLWSSETIRKAGRTYGEVCKKFGKEAVDLAMLSGCVEISGNEWRRSENEEWFSGVSFDPTRCNHDTPLTANGINIG